MNEDGVGRGRLYCQQFRGHNTTLPNRPELSGQWSGAREREKTEQDKARQGNKSTRRTIRFSSRLYISFPSVPDNLYAFGVQSDPRYFVVEEEYIFIREKIVQYGEF